MRKYTVLLAMLLGVFALPALAANLPLKAPAPVYSGYPAISGWYFGLYSEVGAGSSTITDPAVVGASTGKVFDASADFGGLVGYVRCSGAGSPAMPNASGFCISVEASVGWQNLNAQSTGLSITGPLVLGQGVSVSTPLSNIISMLPSFNIFGNAPTPGLPALPSGVTAGSGTLGLWLGVKEQDVSAQFLTSAAKAWAISFEVGPEMRWRLSNNMAAVVRTVYVPPTNEFCVASGRNQNCAGIGQGLFTKVMFDY